MKTKVNLKTALLERLYDEGIQEGKNTRMSANLLNRLGESLAGLGFINELLQNASDAKATTIRFTIVNDYLIVEHNGTAFTEKNVIRICDAADPENEKSDDNDAIGHKGIGFKAVFSFSDEVTIISGGYTFKFSKNHSHWEANPSKYPWHTIPIITEKSKLPHQVLTVLDAKKTVTTILKLRNSKDSDIFYEEMQSLMQDARILLFLQPTQEVEIVRDGKCESFALSVKSSRTLKEEKEESDDSAEDENEEKIVKAEKEVTEFGVMKNKKEALIRWIKLEESIPIPSEIKAALVADPTIPKKYKKDTFTHVSVGLAVKVENGKIVTIDKLQVFCFLPTDIRWEFPFILNAEFLMEPARNHLLKGKTAEIWNAFLLPHAFRLQFYLSHYLARHKKYWRQALFPITSVDEVTLGTMQIAAEAAEEMFERGISETRPIKALDQSTRIAIRESYVDKYRFIKEFASDIYGESCAHPEIEESYKLVDLKANMFDIKNIIEVMKEKWFIKKCENPVYFLKFLKFVMELCNEIGSHEVSALKSTLKNSSIFPDFNKKLHKPNELLFPNETLKGYFRDFSYLHIINPGINESDNPELGKLLDELGVKAFTITELIARANKHEDELEKFASRVIHLFHKGRLEEDKLRSFNSLKLKTKNGEFIAANKCYLPDDLNPEFPIEQFQLEGIEVVEHQYLQDETDLNRAKEFLIKLGVRHELQSSNAKDLVTMLNEKGDCEVQINFVKAVFSIYYDEKSTKEEKAFLRLVPHLKEMLVATTQKTFVLATNTYLADVYQPEVPLQKVATGLSFVTADYLQDEKNPQIIAQWRNFWLALGVGHTVELKYESNLNRTKFDKAKPDFPMADKYFSYLQRQIYPDQGEAATALFPKVQNGYPGQHYISSYCYHEFIEELAKTTYFWQIIKDNWSLIQSRLSKVQYRTRFFQREIPSSIHYFVHLALQHQYEKSAGDLYTPRMREILAETANELDIADVAKELSDEQIEYFSFRKFLSLKDCLLLLKNLATQNDKADVLKKIAVIYKAIAAALNRGETFSADESNLKSLRLLNQKNEFVLAKKLFALCGSNIPNIDDNPLILRRPQTVSFVDFERACTSLGVKIIKDANCEITTMSRSYKSSLLQYLGDKALSILLLECLAHDIEEQALEDFLGNNLVRVIKNLNVINLVFDDSLVLSYPDVFRKSLNIWFDENKATLYSRGLDPIARKEFMKCLKNFLGLKCDEEQLWHLLEMPSDQFAATYPQANLTKERLAFVARILDEVVAGTSKQITQMSSVVNTEVDVERNTDSEEVAAEERAMDVENTSSQPVVSATATSSSRKRAYGFAGSSGGFSKEDTTKRIKVDEAANPRSQTVNNSAAISSGNRKVGPITRYLKRINMKEKDESNRRIGRNGEQHVHDYFYARYKEKYEGKLNYQLEETAEGISISGPNGYQKCLIWYNKGLPVHEDSGRHYDFKIKTRKRVEDSEIQKRRYIEVKSTGANEETHKPTLSADEWQHIENLKSKIATSNNPDGSGKKYSYTLFSVRNLTAQAKEQWKQKQYKRFHESPEKFIGEARTAYQLKLE